MVFLILEINKLSKTQPGRLSMKIKQIRPFCYLNFIKDIITINIITLGNGEDNIFK